MELVARARSTGETAPQTRSGQMISRETLRTGVITFIARRQRPPLTTQVQLRPDRGALAPSLPLNPAVLWPDHMRGALCQWASSSGIAPIFPRLCAERHGPGGSNRSGPPRLEQRSDTALSGAWSPWEIPNRPPSSNPPCSSGLGVNRSSWILTHGVKGNELTPCRFINGIHSKINQLCKFLGRGLRRGC